VFDGRKKGKRKKKKKSEVKKMRALRRKGIYKKGLEEEEAKNCSLPQKVVARLAPLYC